MCARVVTTPARSEVTSAVKLLMLGGAAWGERLGERRLHCTLPAGRRTPLPEPRTQSLVPVTLSGRPCWVIKGVNSRVNLATVFPAKEVKEVQLAGSEFCSEDSLRSSHSVFGCFSELWNKC